MILEYQALVGKPGEYSQGFLQLHRYKGWSYGWRSAYVPEWRIKHHLEAASHLP
jgi:hypothetical protein